MSAENTSWIAVDWGTSRLRVWVFDKEGRRINTMSSDHGMGTLEPTEFEAALLALISDHLPTGRETPVICCGMVGARQGWCEAPYKKTPCIPPNALNAVTVLTNDPRIKVRILPGIKQEKPADVMRGEETQIAGYLTSDPQFDGVICLPGTHTKWAHISAGEVVSFRTFMTGELFSLLSKNSVLRHGIAATGWSDEAFSAAVDDALAEPQKISARLFQLRAETLLNGLPPEEARAHLSGLLVGIELAAARPYWLGQNIVVLGSDQISNIYQKALAQLGAIATVPNAESLTLAGLTSAYYSLKETVK